MIPLFARPANLLAKMEFLADLWDNATAMVRLVSVVGFHDGNKNHRWTELDRPDLATHRPAGVVCF